MKSLEPFKLPSHLVENQDWLEALYHFIQASNPALSVQENLSAQMAKYNEALNAGPDLSTNLLGGAFAGLDRQVDHLNILFNKRKGLILLTESLPACENLLQETLANSTFRETLKAELDALLFEEPGFGSRLLDTFFRMKGCVLGSMRSKKDCNQG